MQKKFLLIIDNLSTGGAQRQMVNLALGLTQRGYRVELFCYEQGDLLASPLYEAGIPIHWQTKRSRFSLDVISALRKLISQGNYDLVLSFLPTANFYAVLTGRLLQFRKIPVIVSERRSVLPEGATFMEKFAREFYRFATHVVTNSHHQRVQLEESYPWMKNRLSTIYNGYDLEAFTPAPAEPDNEILRILTIASVSPHKNGLCLVEALHLLMERDRIFPHVDWIGQLVMKSFRLDYLNQMKEAIEKYQLEQQWLWMNQRTDIVDQLHQHDVLVHCSYGEGLPNVVCEALACGRPVIVSNVLDHARLVQDGKSGFLFNHKDPADLAEKIKMFINLTPEQRREMGRCGREFAVQNLSLKKFTDEYEHLFLDLVK